MGSKISCVKNNNSVVEYNDCYPLDDLVYGVNNKGVKCCDDPRCGDFFWPGGFGMCRTELDLKQKRTEKMYANKFS